MGRRSEHIQGLVLERHRSRRAQGVPTLGVLIGDAAVAEWCWSRWQRSRGASFVPVVGDSPAQILGEWISKSAVLAALRREILRRGAATRGENAEEFALTLEAFLRGSRFESIEEIGAWVGARPELVAIVASADAEALLAWLLGGFPRSLAEVDQILPDGLPGMFARIPVAASSSVFDEVVTSAIRIAEAVPRVELALSMTREELASWRQRADARERHLVAEGVIQIEAAESVAGRRRRPSSAAMPVVGQERTAGQAVASNAGRERAGPSSVAQEREVRRERTGREREDGATGGMPRLAYDPAEFARSRAERTLFEHLEARTRTRGLFRLNGTIPEPFGGRHLEVDLLSEQLRVALEIDGYHHFRDEAAYRRDRDKDVRLQRLGFTVVRVLATDVDVEIDYVTDTIDQVVDHEKQKRAP